MTTSFMNYYYYFIIIILGRVRVRVKLCAVEIKFLS